MSDERPPFHFQSLFDQRADARRRLLVFKFVIDRSLERKKREHEIYGSLDFVNPVLPVSPDAGTDVMDGGDVMGLERFFYPQIEVRRIDANKNRRGSLK